MTIEDEVYEFWNDPRNIAKHSHIPGVCKWMDEKKWKERAKFHHQLFWKLFHLNKNEGNMGIMLEWGCGGGINYSEFYYEFCDYFAVDISEKTLAKFSQRYLNDTFCTAKPVIIDVANPEGILEEIKEPIDFFLSTAVFQHFPSKEYGIRVLEIAHKLLDKKGIALIEIRYNNGNPYYKPKIENYSKNVITFNSYRIDEFWQICERVGLEPLSVVLVPKTNNAYFLLKKGMRDER